MAVLLFSTDEAWMLRSYLSMFPVLWGWAPLDAWLSGLRDTAQETAPLEEDAVVATLSEARLRGWLGADPREVPHGGRAVLDDANIRAVASPSLREKLSAQLGSTGSRPTPGRWAELAVRSPGELLERFLERSFLVWTQDVEGLELRWDVTRHEFPEYAAAVRTAVTGAATRVSDERARELVQLHAGRDAAVDARVWLSGLEEAVCCGAWGALRTADRSDLRA